MHTKQCDLRGRFSQEDGDRAGSPAENFEHTLSYLKSVLAFIGIANPEVIAADGVNISSDQRKSSLTKAEAQVATLKIA